MAHSIDAYIAATEDLAGFPTHPLNQGFSFFKKPEKGELKFDYVHVTTDYFGGGGTQGAAYFQDGKQIFASYQDDNDANDEFCASHEDYAPINHALELLGVRKVKDYDEFDTIGLCDFRDEKDIQYKIRKHLPKLSPGNEAMFSAIHRAAEAKEKRDKIEEQKLKERQSLVEAKVDDIIKLPVLEVRKVDVITNRVGEDVLILTTNLPPSNYPWKETPSVSLKAAKGSGEEYARKNFPGATIEVI